MTNTFCFCKKGKKERHKRKKLNLTIFFEERDCLEVINRKRERES